MKLYTMKEALALVGENPRVIYEENDEGYLVGLKQRKGDAFYPMQQVRDIHTARNVKTQYQRGLREISEHTAPSSPVKFYTMDEVLPLVDATARAYVETVADAYVIGVEHNNEVYPLQTSKESVMADAIVIDLQHALDEHFGVEANTDFDEEEAALLEGFTFVPNKGMAQILIGKRNRLYLKGDITTLLDIRPRERVLIAFNPQLEAFAIVKPSAVAVTNEMRAAGYFVSQRKDITCAKLFREFHLDKFEGQTFYADKTSLSGNVVVFRR